MTPTKLLIGQALVVFAIVIAGVWFATEWCAAELEFQSQLGSPWFVLLGLPVYRPWQLFAWWFWYDAYAPAVFNKAGAIAASSGLAGCAVAIVGSLWRARQNRLVTTYRLLALGDQPGDRGVWPVSFRWCFPGPPRWEVSTP